MKKKWILVKIMLFLAGLIFLLAFAQNKYKLRDVQEIKTSIDYSSGNHFITHAMVDSLLRKSHPDYPNMHMNRVYTRDMEYLLNQDEHISKANVYLENDGKLFAEIEQEVPLIRVKNGNKEYYISKYGKQVPLSKKYAAKVLLIQGDIVENEYEGLVDLCNLIYGDKLLKNIIIGVRKEKVNSFILLVNKGSYILEIGDLENIENKLENFKVFHNKYITQMAEMPYKNLNLKYDNQIVASK